jgi:hypothetical protein
MVREQKEALGDGEGRERSLVCFVRNRKKKELGR